MTNIPNDFDEESNELFDIEYMNALFDVGYDVINKGDPWITKMD